MIDEALEELALRVAAYRADVITLGRWENLGKLLEACDTVVAAGEWDRLAAHAAKAELARACTGCDSPLPILCRECYRKDMEETRQRAEVAEVDRSKYRAASLDLMGQMDALREALDAMVNCPVGGSGQRLPAPEVVAFARAVLRGKGEK